jgi:hypothetical protein
MPHNFTFNTIREILNKIKCKNGGGPNIFLKTCNIYNIVSTMSNKKTVSYRFDQDKSTAKDDDSVFNAVREICNKIKYKNGGGTKLFSQ